MKKTALLLLPILTVIASACTSNNKTINTATTPLQDSIIAYIEEGFANCIRYKPNDTGIYFGLPYPFVVPAISENFDNMFYWDNYFMNKGLFKLGLDSLAKFGVDNLLFEVEKWGYVLNINHYYGTHRTQQPYLSLMVMDIYKQYPDSTEWLANAYATLKKEYDFFMTNRMSPIGLNMQGHEMDKEMLLSFYDYLKNHRFKELNYTDTAEILDYASRRITEAEVWDWTPRFDIRADDFCPVDLNSNLYLYEKNFAEISRILGLGEEEAWEEKAQQRLQLMNQYLWDEEMGIFCDYDFANQKKSTFKSVGIFNPLFCGWATQEQANKLLQYLQVLEFDYGISTCEKNESGIVYQWDYPNGWAPAQYIVAQGLANYGLNEEAQRVKDKYIRVVEKNFETTKRLWEKYNVVNGTIEVKDEYQMPEMFGWTAGIYLEFLLEQ